MKDKGKEMSSSRSKPNIRPRNPKLLLFRFVEWLAVLVVTVLVMIAILFVAMNPMVVKEKSVKELTSGNLVFADRLTKFFAPYGRGDIVAYRAYSSEKLDDSAKDDYPDVGRVIAFGGETVLITGGKLYVDGVLLDEREYASDFQDEIYSSFTVLENKLLILPDDRSKLESVTADDYTFEYSEIIGEIRFRVYPFGEIEFYI